MAEPQEDGTRTPLDSEPQEDGTRTPLDSDRFVFVEVGHPSEVLEVLNSLRLKKYLCDVVLCCGGQEFPCHRIILASISSYFQAMFTSGFMESRQPRVDIEQMEPQTIAMLVNYAYTAKVVISTTNVQALLAAANLWDVVAVREACCRYMERHLDTSNCIGIHLFAEAHFCKSLEKYSMDYILDHFCVIYQQEEFLSLPVDKLTEILASDLLGVPTEDMVFEAAMLWLNKCTTRRHSFGKVLERIQVHLISPSYLPNVIESLDVLKESQGCQRLISEAKDNSARPRMSSVMVGGDVLHRSDSVVSFNPLTNKWKTLGKVPFKISDFGVAVSGLVMLGGFVYAVGGCEESGRPSMERYNPRTNTWQFINSIPHFDNIRAVVALDGLLYVYGSLEYVGITYTYNHKTSLWTPLWSNNVRWSEHVHGSAICSLNGRIYDIGGTGHTGDRDPQHYTSCMVHCYSPKSSQWTRCADLIKGRVKPGVAVVEGKLYVVGGNDRTKRGRCTVKTQTRGNLWRRCPRVLVR